MIADDFKRLLKERAGECTLAELDDLLEKYGNDDGYLHLIRDGILARLKREDSGDYTSRATSGWQPTMNKKKRLEQFILARGPTASFHTAAAPAGKADPQADTIAALNTRISALEHRLQLLERRCAAQKFKL